MASVEELKQELQQLIESTKAMQQELETQGALDAVIVAAQTYRLDLASLLLGAVGIIVAVGGVIGFFEVRYRAKNVAIDTAKQECKTIAKDLLKIYTNDELPDEVRRLVESIAGDMNTDGDAYGKQDTDQKQS